MPAQRDHPESRSSAFWLDAIEPRRAQSMIRIFFWTITAVVGFVQMWSLRFSLTEDGNSYLDIASTYLRGDYAHAVNASFSPMFSWLIAFVLKVFNPSGFYESTGVRLLNLAGLLISLGCFEFFFVAFLQFLKQFEQSNVEPLLSERVWWLLGYGLFSSTSLLVLTMEPATPDIWVCAVSYLAVGTLLRIALHSRNLRYFAVLGLVLGLAYLTKAFYFPLSFIFLLVACLQGQGLRRNLGKTVVALFVFALVAGPFITALSKSKGRFTYGDIGTIAYAMFMDPIPQIEFWHGENQTGIPVHPTREILSFPEVFEFDGPVIGSYPVTYDLSYWAEGVRVHFSLRGQLRILRQSVGTHFQILLLQSEFAVGFLIFLLSKDRLGDVFTSAARLWLLWLPPLAGCAAYALVLTEIRYIAPFVVFLWLALFGAVLQHPSAVSRRVAIAIVLGMLALTGIKTTKYFVTDVLASKGQRNTDWEVAQCLQEFGVKPGDKVSVIAARSQVHWARLAGVKIVAEVPLGQDKLFWTADESTQEKVFAAFAATGSRAVVAKEPPSLAMHEGWMRLGETDYFAHPLPQHPQSLR